jgi:hypothetical protein
MEQGRDLERAEDYLCRVKDSTTEEAAEAEKSLKVRLHAAKMKRDFRIKAAEMQRESERAAAEALLGETS